MTGFSRLTTPFTLRLPNPILERLEEEADRLGVSVASLIIDALRVDYGEVDHEPECDQPVPAPVHEPPAATAKPTP